MNKKVSVIIPAYNEEKFIQKTLESYKAQNYNPLEIVVVVNNSTDKTYEIANRYADKVLNFPGKIGVSRARNEGAKIATGEIFIFSDADTYLTQGGVRKIAEITDNNTVSVPLGASDDKFLRGKLFFFYKNLGHRLHIYRSAIFGVISCHKDVFCAINGFDENKKIAEHSDFIKRAVRAGAQYKLIDDFYAVTSLRRFMRNGYFHEYLFWIQWRILSWLGKSKELENKYFN